MLALLSWPEPGALLPIDRLGRIEFRHLTPQAVYNALRKRAVEAGIRRAFSLHSLRRFFASELLGQDAGISDVKELLGHASNETTAIYDRRAERAKQKTACSQAETLGSTRPAKNQTLSVIPLHND